MKLVFKNLIFISLILLLHSDSTRTFLYWPLWRDFRQYYISEDGRVIDSSSSSMITTSEGQSYALFFALIANDRTTFDKLFHWTENNLAAGNLKTHLPAWLWGQNTQKQWAVLDQNSATDADLWLAYDLLEAGRLWNNQHYALLGTQLLEQILKKEVVEIPGWGNMLLPGPIGFVSDDSWRLNPSYLPLQLLTKFSALNNRWKLIEQNSLRFIIESSPKGFSPDWIIWSARSGWKPDEKQPNLGSYNAIRVYLWAGMLDNNLSYKKELVLHFLPMIMITKKLGIPPKLINTETGTYKGRGPIGFSAALLPLLEHTSILKQQRLRVNQSPLTNNNYYNSVLRLFGQGWDQQYFRFNQQGELLPEWN